MNNTALLASLNSQGMPLVTRKELEIDNANYFVSLSSSLEIWNYIYSAHKIIT